MRLRPRLHEYGYLPLPQVQRRFRRSTRFSSALLDARCLVVAQESSRARARAIRRRRRIIRSGAIPPMRHKSEYLHAPRRESCKSCVKLLQGVRLYRARIAPRLFPSFSLAFCSPRESVSLSLSVSLYRMTRFVGGILSGIPRGCIWLCQSPALAIACN